MRRRGTRSRSIPLPIGVWPIVLAALSGCAPAALGPVAEVERREAVINPPRSELGNPPFYDVLGRRYHVEASREGYRETGVASWYGEDFHGLRTSSGEPYDMYAMTAAHTTLPLPTWVEVTHLGNGKRVIVKVNDRGPFLHDRLIDLSYGAAQVLDMVGDGTARVEVRALGVPGAGRLAEPPDEAAQPPSGLSGVSQAAPATAAAQPHPMERIYVQVGVFAEPRNAHALRGELETAGYARVRIDVDPGRSPAVHRVRLGPFARSDNIAEVVDSLAAAGMDATLLVVEH